jgi:glycosyltransferase involved in cell wall biosynthesis
MDPEVSLALPCFNECDNIARVLEHSISVLEQLGAAWELIVIDNHSSDGTPERVRPFAERDRRVRLIVHDVNRYYSGSCWTALAQARGQRVAIMDSDGQFSAHDLPRFLQKLDEGANLVMGWRKVRHDPPARKAMSWVFNKMAQRYLGSELHDLNVGIRMFDRQFIAAAQIKHSLNLANPELYVRAKLAGLVVAEVEASHFPRDEGQSCHSVLKLCQTFLKVRRYFRDLQNELRASAKSETNPGRREAASCP